MAYELQDGQGTLFKNEKQNDKQPDYRGQCKIDGRLLDMAGWLKQGKKVKYMFLVITPPREQAPAPAAGTPQPAPPVYEQPSENPEDIPF